VTAPPGEATSSKVVILASFFFLPYTGECQTLVETINATVYTGGNITEEQIQEFAVCAQDAMLSLFDGCLSEWPHLWGPIECLLSLALDEVQVDESAGDSDGSDGFGDGSGQVDVVVAGEDLTESNCTSTFGTNGSYLPFACLAIVDLGAATTQLSEFITSLSENFAGVPSCQPISQIFVGADVDPSNITNECDDLDSAAEINSNPFEAALEQCEEDFQIGVEDTVQTFEVDDKSHGTNFDVSTGLMLLVVSSMGNIMMS